MNIHASLRAAPTMACLAVALSAVSCGRGGQPLHGVRIPRALSVGDVVVREVREDGPAPAFRFRAGAGRLLYVFFGYAHCPDICPTTLADLRRALRLLGPDAARIEVAFVTVDPGRDSAAVLVPFVHTFVPGGHALQPSSQEELAAAERAFDAASSVSRRADGTVDVTHTGAGYVVDAGGRVLLEWDYGTKPADMAADFGVLLRLNRREP